MSLTLQQMDAISPAGSWADDDIIEWARRHGMNHAPITYVPLQTTAQEQQDTARIDWRAMTVRREHCRPPL